MPFVMLVFQCRQPAILCDLHLTEQYLFCSLPISCTKQISTVSAFVFNTGNTALHDCAESGSLDIMKLLFSYNAQLQKDSYGMTPLLAAAVTGNTKVVEYLIERPDSTRPEKIDALELLGATFVDKKRDLLGAIKFWKCAMLERYRDKNDILMKPKGTGRVKAYNNTEEVRTTEDLDELVAEPDEMRMQALLIRERILGPAHPDTSYYIRYRGAVYADMGDFDWCIKLWMYALDMQQKHLEPLNPMTQSSFLSFAELFSFMMTESRQRRCQVVPFKDMMIIFDKSVQELEKGMTQISKMPGSDRDLTNFNRYLVIIVHLISLIGRLSMTLSERDLHHFKRNVYRLVHMNPRGTHGLTPLHLASSKDTTNVGRYPVCSFPDLTVVKLLLEVGASINAVDHGQNTPLHIAAKNEPCQPDVITVLLNHGAHLDACNVENKNPMQLLQGISIHEIVPPLKFISLQCLAAKTIMRHGIVFHGQVPQKLEAFIRMH